TGGRLFSSTTQWFWRSTSICRGVYYTDTSTPGARGEYVSKHIQEPDWDKQFFPSFTFINIQGAETGRTSLGDATCHMPCAGGECNDLFKPIYEVVWSDQDGTFVSWRRKIDGTFAERLELHYFPLDRQLCRIKITAEKPIEDFQFVMLKKDHKHHFSRACDTFKVDQEMQKLCGSYVRYCDFELPFPSQRSMVNVIFHLDRQGDYYFNNMLLMVFLVNLMGLCAFAIPLHDASGRLSLVSSCFLAVLAYRYIINEILPRKAYLTAADKYITFACMFLIVICLQTVVFVIWRRGIEEVKEGQLSLASLWTRSTLDFYHLTRAPRTSAPQHLAGGDQRLSVVSMEVVKATRLGIGVFGE
ncbi:unnamed protein product, partial [Durusdinium trenchii]